MWQKVKIKYRGNIYTGSLHSINPITSTYLQPGGEVQIHFGCTCYHVILMDDNKACISLFMYDLSQIEWCDIDNS